MKKLLLIPVMLCLTITSPLSVHGKQGPEKQGMASCISCHSDFSSVLPKKHKPVRSGDITACVACHKPDFAGNAEPKPYSASIHRPHVKRGAKTDCTLCHTWVPGKRFGVKGVKTGQWVVSKAGMDGLKAAFDSWAGSTHLDAAHGKAGIVCLACHGKTLPEQGDTVENERCLACHGSLESLAARSAPKDFPDRNPHKSHLGEIACTVCHHGHMPSKVYCLGCHSRFNMKIPGN